MTAIKKESARLGWVGTGVMGASMAMNLLRAGWRLNVTSRTRMKSEALIAAGASWAETPAQVAKQSDVVFVMVGYPSEVELVILGKNGVLEGFAEAKNEDGCSVKRRMVVDMTTSRPELAKRIFREAAVAGIESLDAPVSGGDTGARTGTLSIMIGGEEKSVEWLYPAFSLLGKTIQYQGPAGSGQHTKMVNQILIAGNMGGLCEALLYARRSGLDMEKVLASVEKGAAGSWSLSNLAPRILCGDFTPGFFVEHFIKDMEIALEEADRMNLSLPVLQLVLRLYQATRDAGHEKSGTQALLYGLEALNAEDSLKEIKKV